MSNVPFIQPTIGLGVWTAGEIPTALVHTFTNEDGSAAWTDPSGWSAQWSHQPGRGAVTTITPTVAENGQVTVSWDGDSFAMPGAYEADLWAWNTERRVVARFRFSLAKPVAVPTN